MGNPSFVDVNAKHSGLLFNFHGLRNDILKKKKVGVLLVLHGLQLHLTFHLVQQSVSAIFLSTGY